MKDVTGYPIELGDRVVYSHGGRYHGFADYYVVGFTPSLLRLSRDEGGKEHRKASPLSCAVVSGRPER